MNMAIAMAGQKALASVVVVDAATTAAAAAAAAKHMAKGDHCYKFLSQAQLGASVTNCTGGKKKQEGNEEKGEGSK